MELPQGRKSHPEGGQGDTDPQDFSQGIDRDFFTYAGTDKSGRDNGYDNRQGQRPGNLGLHGLAEQGGKD